MLIITNRATHGRKYDGTALNDRFVHLHQALLANKEVISWNQRVETVA